MRKIPRFFIDWWCRGVVFQRCRLLDITFQYVNQTRLRFSILIIYFGRDFVIGNTAFGQLQQNDNAVNHRASVRYMMAVHWMTVRDLYRDDSINFICFDASFGLWRFSLFLKILWALHLSSFMLHYRCLLYRPSNFITFRLWLFIFSSCLSHFYCYCTYFIDDYFQ